MNQPSPDARRSTAHGRDGHPARLAEQTARGGHCRELTDEHAEARWNDRFRSSSASA